MLPMIAAKAKKTNFWLSKLESYSYLHEVEVRYGAVDRISKKCDWYCRSGGNLMVVFEFFKVRPQGSKSPYFDPTVCFIG